MVVCLPAVAVYLFGWFIFLELILNTFWVVGRAVYNYAFDGDTRSLGRHLKWTYISVCNMNIKCSWKNESWHYNIIEYEGLYYSNTAFGDGFCLMLRMNWYGNNVKCLCWHWKEEQIIMLRRTQITVAYKVQYTVINYFKRTGKCFL